MNLKTIKKDDKLEFHGVKIDREYRDNELYSVKVIFEDGNFFIVAKHGWSDLCLTVKAPPKTVKKLRITGRYHDDDNYSRVFDDVSKGERWFYDQSDSDLKKEEFEEQVEE